MIYNMTIEKVCRFSIEFEAENDEEAMERAEDMYDNALEDAEDFTYDYALCRESGETVVDWSK